jgi:hypothetical protein
MAHRYNVPYFMVQCKHFINVPHTIALAKTEQTGCMREFFADVRSISAALKSGPALFLSSGKIGNEGSGRTEPSIYA